MAARGHVQDPNDRRLRPIYGKIRTAPLGLKRLRVSDLCCGTGLCVIGFIKALQELW